MEPGNSSDVSDPSEIILKTLNIILPEIIAGLDFNELSMGKKRVPKMGMKSVPLLQETMVYDGGAVMVAPPWS
jgi:hypothetical protein